MKNNLQANFRGKKLETKTSKIFNFFEGLKGLIFSVSAFLTALSFWLFNFFVSQNVYAGNIGSSKFITGTTKMMEDATAALIVVAPVITVFVVGYCFLKKGAGDEMDHRKWDTRISTAIVSCIGVVGASILVKLIMDYYK